MSVYASTSLMKVPLGMESGVRDTVDSERRERRIRVLHEFMTVVVGPLQKCELRRFHVKTRELVEWKYVPRLVSYCYNILKPRIFQRCVTLLR